MSHKNIRVLGLNFINIILIVIFLFFKFIPFKESSHALNTNPCISLSRLSVFSSLAMSTTTHKEIHAVCKIRRLHAQRKQKWKGLKTCFGVLKGSCYFKAVMYEADFRGSP